MSDSEFEDEPMYDSEEEFQYGSDDDFDYGDEPITASPVPGARKLKYRILSPYMLRDRQKEVVAQVADLLVISQNEAVRVLRHYKWDAAKLQDEWFTDPDAVKEKVGLVDEQPAPRKKNARCPICFENFPLAAMSSSKCKHYVCKECWKGYIHTSVEGGVSCLGLRCPDPECPAAVPRSLVMEVADADHKRRYEQFEVRSFVDDNRHLVWCPAPDCENAAEAVIDVPREAMDVFCECGNAFCFNCKEEAHRPVDCETVKQWMIKNSAESENMNWILANTKPCPKCTRPIEKNQGCMHITCSQCRHEFCWLCLGPWAEHGERTGGFYNCNVYKKKVDKGDFDEEEQKRQHARMSLERYMHYWQRWAEHDKAKRMARKQMERWEKEQLDELGEKVMTPASQLRFILDAWKEVINCRRVLKWTYAVGYYTFDEAPPTPKSLKDKEASKQFFEFTQRDAEDALERMNHKVEKILPAFLREEGAIDMNRWAAFREELMGLTDVTRSQFGKLVDFLEKGLDAGLKEFSKVAVDPMNLVNSGPSGSGTAAGPNGSGSGGGAGAGAGGPSGTAAAAAEVARRITRSTTRRDNTGKAPLGPGGQQSSALEMAAGHWQCDGCTFANEDLSATRCEMCQRPRRERR